MLEEILEVLKDLDRKIELLNEKTGTLFAAVEELKNGKACTADKPDYSMANACNMLGLICCKLDDIMEEVGCEDTNPPIGRKLIDANGRTMTVTGYHMHGCYAEYDDEGRG